MVTILFWFLLSAPAAELSREGKAAIQQQLATINKEMEKARANATQARSNAAIVQGDLDALARLVAEFETLKKKHESFVKSMEAEIQKNEKALQKVAAWEKNTLANQDLVLEESQKRQISVQLDQAKQEQVERAAWKTNAQEKLKASHADLAKMKAALQELLSKRPKLLEEKAEAEKIAQEYESVSKKLEKERVATQLLLSGKVPARAGASAPAETAPKNPPSPPTQDPASH